MPDKNEKVESELGAPSELEESNAIEKRVKEIMESDSDAKPAADKPKSKASSDSKTDDGTPPPEKILVIPDHPDDAKLPELNEPEPDTTEPADPVADKAVDDIMAKESDELLAAEDEKLATAFSDKKPTFNDKLKNFLRAWWHNKKARWGTIIGLAVLLFVVLAVPPSRYFVLNTFGVRSSASVTVLDEKTFLPLKGVQVTIGGVSSQTGNDGVAKLGHIKLGASDLVIDKRAFAVVKKRVVIGWGSNPLGEMRLTPVGAQYAFLVTDFLSGKPIEKAEATSGDASAFSDKDGRIWLTVEKAETADLQVTITAETYRTEELKFSVNVKDEQAVKLAPARQHVFVSKRSGKYDLYKVGADGKNETLLLAGTGLERDDLVVVSHPTDEVVALISTREDVRKDGYLLSTLTLIDVTSGQTTKVAQSERVQIVDWVNNNLVYVQIAAGASASNPQRHRLISYDYKNQTSKELAGSNYFNDVTIAKGLVYYAPSGSYGGSDGLFKQNADGTSKLEILKEEVWNIFRVDYDRLNVSVGQDWYEHVIGQSTASKASGPPGNLRTRIYIDSPDKLRSLWVDERDGKGVLLAYSSADKKDAILRTQSGLKNPVRWLNDKYVVYRINTDQETADYVLNLDGGEPAKISDATNTSGVDSWYYY